MLEDEDMEDDLELAGAILSSDFLDPILFGERKGDERNAGKRGQGNQRYINTDCGIVFHRYMRVAPCHACHAYATLSLGDR